MDTPTKWTLKKRRLIVSGDDKGEWPVRVCLIEGEESGRVHASQGIVGAQAGPQGRFTAQYRMLMTENVRVSTLVLGKVWRTLRAHFGF